MHFAKFAFRTAFSSRCCSAASTDGLFQDAPVLMILLFLIMYRRYWTRGWSVLNNHSYEGNC